MNNQPATPADQTFFLPDFCRLQSVFAVVVLAEIFALILVLAAPANGLPSWEQLALVSLFMQWTALAGAGALCLARRWLIRLPMLPAALIGYLLLLLIIGLLLQLAWQFILQPMQAVDSRPSFLLRNLAIGAMVSGLMLHHFYISHQSRRRLAAEGEARIAALQARIHPHFLFNSLNSIASLVQSDPARAEAAIEDLADLFRAGLGDGRRLIPFAEERQLCASYLEMEALRLGPRLQVDWDTDAVPADAAIPPLTLQPLLENAVHHGLAQRPEGGRIHIHGKRRQQRLYLTISNPLPTATALAQGRHRGNRMALDNIRQRLQYHFAAGARLSGGVQDGGYVVHLEWPLQTLRG